MKNRLTVCSSHLITLPSAPHGPVRAAIATAREAVAAFDPELVVFFGTDHRRAFRAVVPTFAVVLAATAQGDVAGPVGTYDVPSELGRALVANLVAHDFDIATAYEAALDHAFGHTARDLLGEINARPVLPIFINCASPPHASFRRAASLGRRVGEFFADKRQTMLLHGMLQIPEYMRAVITACANVSDDEVEERIAARIPRQEPLRNGMKAVFFIPESVLVNSVGGPEVMRAQLLHLEKLATRPNVVVRIVALTAGAHAGMAGSFDMLTFDRYEDVVFLESENSSLIIEAPEPVKAYGRIVEGLDQVALDAEQSKELIKKLLM
ncbi:Scr1 family TA system antitoxin-like transcriptional regulator [Lentzea flava]|uniref:DUF5753 domain-containing protein n=1 Tax=Lentzea flava TaxID=103732 RepID=A0ABQ2UJM0_9PSEU|nr:Scr1 family TA system antitoxin-like transcriptional regulator [Lentzea flava]MCP2200237.1 Catalytic LigB subunit of aromatic ring-opening dioxygenase [Lentzea flava]GGU40900.1 hypothetical protein GCM10010178_36780 [Lentzea flava]